MLALNIKEAEEPLGLREAVVDTLEEAVADRLGVSQVLEVEVLAILVVVLTLEAPRSSREIPVLGRVQYYPLKPLSMDMLLEWVWARRGLPQRCL